MNTNGVSALALVLSLLALVFGLSGVVMPSEGMILFTVSDLTTHSFGNAWTVIIETDFYVNASSQVLATYEGTFSISTSFETITAQWYLDGSPQLCAKKWGMFMVEGAWQSGSMTYSFTFEEAGTHTFTVKARDDGGGGNSTVRYQHIFLQMF